MLAISVLVSSISQEGGQYDEEMDASCTPTKGHMEGDVLVENNEQVISIHAVMYLLGYWVPAILYDICVPYVMKKFHWARS